MIIDSLHNAMRYIDLHPCFQQVLEYLQQTDFTKLADGKIELVDKNIFLTIATNAGKENAMLESHRDFIDIQMPLSATETIGWKSTAICRETAKAYDAQSDITFYSDKYDTTFIVHPGQFVIFFPEDAHAPAMSDGMLRKLVVKVKIKQQTTT